MSKLHKKCFLASAGMHVLLFLVLLVGPAFLMTRETAKEVPTLDFIPAKLIDATLDNQPAPKRQSNPKQPRPQVKQPKPVRPEKVQTRDPVQQPKKAEPKYTKPEEIDLRAAKRRLTPRTSRTPPSTQPREDYEVAANTIRKAAATSSIKISSPSGGGPAFASYDMAIKTKYEQNWFPPTETSRDDAVVRVQVVIAKDGTVRSAKIIGRCGDAGVDASVDATLRRVTKVPPFPAGAKEITRTYTIGFSLKAKRALG